MKKLDFLIFSIFLFFFVLACKKRTQDERLNVRMNFIVEGKTFPAQNKQVLVFKVGDQIQLGKSLRLNVKFDNSYHNYQKLNIVVQQLSQSIDSINTTNISAVTVVFNAMYDLINTQIEVDEPQFIHYTILENRSYLVILEFKDSYSKQPDKNIQFEIQILN